MSTAAAADRRVAIQSQRRVRTHRRHGSDGWHWPRPFGGIRGGKAGVRGAEAWDSDAWEREIARDRAASRSRVAGRDRAASRDRATARDRKAGRSKVLGKLVAAGLAVSLVLAVIGLMVPLPFADQAAAKAIAKRVAEAVACSKTAIPQPTVKVSGARLTSLIRRRLPKVDLAVRDLTFGPVKHANVAATLSNVSQPRPDIIRAGGVSAAVSIGFADLPVQTDQAQLSFARSADGQLTVGVKPAGAGDSGDAKLLAAVELKGETVNVIPQQVLMFGKTLPAQQFAAQTGGTRTQELPHLPDGLKYKSISPGSDGLRVAIGGTVTTAFSTLPATVDGQPVTYRAQGNLMAISTSKEVPILGTLPVTLYVSPKLGPGALEMVPQSVDVLGANRTADDAIGKLVMDKIDRSSLTKKLPDLPSGVQYKSATVDPAGIKVVIDGTTVRSFSELPSEVNGRAASYGAQGNLLAVTIKGSQGQQGAPIQLSASPKIADGNLDLGVQQVQVLGATLPAGDLLSKFGTVKTSYPLTPLPEGLVYQRVEVLADGLRVTVTGHEVTLSKGSSAGGLGGGGGGCQQAAAVTP